MVPAFFVNVTAPFLLPFSSMLAALPKSWAKLRTEKRRKRQIARRIRRQPAGPLAVEPSVSAEVAGLRYVNDLRQPGIRRIGGKTRFRYVDPNGRTVSDRDVIQRIKALVIPPAWTAVWICPNPLGHLQATGRDARGRKQYRYHARWRQVRDEVKYGRLIAFAGALPKIRERTASDLTRTGLPREKILAAVVELLEKTLIRIGNEEYARDNHSYGLTTMRDTHAKVNGASVRFAFKGKSGVAHSIDLNDSRLARIVKTCRDLPGHELFQYLDDEGQTRAIDSSDVNDYVHDVSGESFTAKDFRTWAGTVLVAQALAESTSGRARSSDRAKKMIAKRAIVRAVESVAKRLGNTVSVCRKCYIHPVVLDAYLDGDVIVIPKRHAKTNHHLSPQEAAVVKLIERRSRRTR